MGCGASQSAQGEEVKPAAVERKSDDAADAAELMDERAPHVNDYITRMKKYKKVFRSVDKDKNGTLSYDEVKVLLEKAGEKTTAKRIKRWIRKADENHDGVISWVEFVEAMDKNTYCRHHKGAHTHGEGPTLEQVLSFWDENFGGHDKPFVRRKHMIKFYMSELKMTEQDAREEAKRIIDELKKHHPEGSPDEVESHSFFHEASKDEPPQIKQVRMKRFQAAMATLAIRWKKLDKNGDGSVSLEEFMKDSKTSALVQQGFKNMDMDGDGDVTWADFVAELKKNHNIMLDI